MILQGNQRAGARNLAAHLLKEENDHVEIHELRGFIADDLKSALDESYAISKGTRAKKYLFSLSLNPPPHNDVPTAAFEDAINRVEVKLGLTDQPRAVVFHTKNDRRHCHCVWSRIDSSEMKAIPLPHTKLKLMDVSRELFIEHGWKMPEGMVSKEKVSRENFTLAEWQQAKRLGHDHKAMKRMVQECWSASKDQEQLSRLVQERGYSLARGDRRGVVLVDNRCEAYSLSRWAGVKSKDVGKLVKDQQKLPSVAELRGRISRDMIDRLELLKETQDALIGSRMNELDARLN